MSAEEPPFTSFTRWAGLPKVGNYTLDKFCYDNRNLALLYMRQENTRDFFYLVLTPEVWNFINSLPRAR